MALSGRKFFEDRYASLGGRLVDVDLPVCIRLNSLRPSDVVQRLEGLGFVLERVPFLENSFNVVSAPFSVGAITEHLLGYYYVQSAAAQLPALVLDPSVPDAVLDMCAAPGGKLTQLAALMKNKGSIVAFELNPRRVVSLKNNLERCGVRNCVAFSGDASRARKFDRFDKVLLDAPCSGNYVTDPAWFSNRDLEGIKRSAKIQQRLLRVASEVLRPGGVLVYSTCSLDPLEDELNVQWAIDNLPLRLVDCGLDVGDPGLTEVFDRSLSPDIAMCRRFWPHKTRTEGFFLAKLVRT